MNSSLPTLEAVQGELRRFNDPETGRSVAQLEQVKNVRLDDARLTVVLGLTSHSAILRRDVEEDLRSKLQMAFPGLKSIEVEITGHDRPIEPLGELGLRVRSVIVVGSGKGGVGKSTIAAATACGLRRAGSRVGLMDADVYGPSIPHLFGASGRPEITDQRRIRPHVVDGLKVMSMGFLVDPKEAVVWRGPMLHGAITQFLRDTDWGELDYLIIDMPPGTGDIALTLSQLLPLRGAVVVCTPQDVALLDANKAIAMFQKVNIRILGVVENMSGFECPNCGKRHDIFGKGGARARAEELGVPFLGEVPINLATRVSGDEGKIARLFDDPAASAPYQNICYQLARSMAREVATAPAMPSLPVL
jgi:ATP-binding protein involved in chromosome partitioning